jgi:alpha-D-xyloside xylohydrolase
MLSVWAVFNPESKNFQEMKQRGLIVPGTTDYDATNSAAGNFYWNHLIGKLFAQGWDAFWLDSSEPEIAYPHGGESDASLEDRKLFIGNGALYTNVFPLMHTGNVYQHWRETTDKKRVFILTRSAFAGQQRNAATTWSGDVFSTFWSFSRQVPAGLNFALSGMPYWTTDIAGYGPPLARDTHDPAYQELYARWFEYGVFCPIFRTHGHRANDENEVFSYGPVTPILIRYDKLRYRLLPYIYSLAWQVTDHDSTIMRPLVMDWRTDRKTWNIGDEYMFGPDLLVRPVVRCICRPRRLGMTSGLEIKRLEASGLKAAPRSIASRSTCEQDRFFQWDLRLSGQPRNRPPLSNCESIAAPTAASSYMRTRATPMPTKRVSTQSSPSNGIRRRTR